MLESIKRLLGGGAAAHAGWDAAQQWAQQNGHVFKRTREGDGFVIEAQAWRLEWGPPQREYLAGGELRLRAELHSRGELQMLAISRLLMEALERAVFEEFTEGPQTRIDTATPEEMRWLVLFPKLAGPQWNELLDHFGAVGNAGAAVEQWLDGPLAQALLDAARTWLAIDDRLVLIVQRGRLALRLGMPHVEPARLDPAVALFDVALREAQRVARHFDAA